MSWKLVIIVMHLDLILRGNSSGTCSPKCLRRMFECYLACMGLFLSLFINGISHSAHDYRGYLFDIDAEDLLIPYFSMLSVPCNAPSMIVYA